MFAGRRVQIVRDDGYAVPTNSRAGIVSHESKRLAFRRFDDLPDIDAQPIAQKRHLVDETDVDKAERVLDKFCQLSDFGRADWHDFVDARCIQKAAKTSRLRRRAADEFGRVLYVELHVAGVDPLRGKDHKE